MISALKPSWRAREAFHSFTGRAFVFDAAGSIWVAGHYKGDLRFVDLADGSRVLRLSEASAASIDLNICTCWASENSIVVATQSLLVRKWRIESKWLSEPFRVELVATTRAHTLPVRCVDVDASEALVCTGSADRTARVLDSRRGLVATHNFKHDGVVTCVKFQPFALRVATACETFTVCVWDLRQKAKCASIEQHEARIADLVWSRDGSVLFTASHDETVGFWRHDGSAVAPKLTVHERLEAVAPLRGGSIPRFATAGANGSVRTWTMGETGPDASEAAGLAPYVSMTSTARSSALVALTLDTVVSFDPASLRVTYELLCAADEIIACDFVADIDTLVVASSSQTPRLVNARTFQCAKRFVGHSDTVLAVDVGYGVVATACKDATCRVWDAETTQCVALCVGHVDPVTAIALGKDRDRIFVVSAARDRTLKRWTWSPQGDHTELKMAPATAKATGSVMAHEKDINCARVDNDTSARIATGSQDKTVTLWSSDRLELQETLRGHRRGVWDVAFAPSSKRLASASSDKTVKVWSLSNGTCLATLDGHEASVLCVRFLRSDQLVSAAADGVLKLWTPGRARCDYTLRAAESKIWAIALRDDGQEQFAICVGSADGGIQIYQDATADEEAEASRQRADVVAREQSLRNMLHGRDFAGALELAMDLDRPFTAWQAFSQLVTDASALEQLLGQWQEDRARRCLDFVKEWNTDAKKAPVAQRVLAALVSRFGPLPLLANDAILRNALSAYTARHLARIDRLHQSTFLLDATLSHDVLAGVVDSHRIDNGGSSDPPNRRRKRSKRPRPAAQNPE